MNTATWLCEVTAQPVPLHDCLECAEHRLLPACSFPPTVLKALANSMRADDGLLEAQALAQRAGVALLRVTGLLGCTRQAWYGLHAAPPLEKPSEHWSRLRGTIFHAALESLEQARQETRRIEEREVARADREIERLQTISRDRIAELEADVAKLRTPTARRTRASKDAG